MLRRDNIPAKCHQHSGSNEAGGSCRRTLRRKQIGIHLANGTLKLDGSFTEEQTGHCTADCQWHAPSGCPSACPLAPPFWTGFCMGDIPTLREFIGYCLIPSTRDRLLMVIKGNSGEGKSQISWRVLECAARQQHEGAVSGRFPKIRFARADLEFTFCCAWMTICGWKHCGRPATMSNPS